MHLSALSKFLVCSLLKALKPEMIFTLEGDTTAQPLVFSVPWLVLRDEHCWFSLIIRSPLLTFTAEIYLN